MKQGKNPKAILSWLLLAGAMSLAQCAWAATCTSVASGNWGAAGTWSCGAIPAVGDTVVIVSPHTVTLNNNYSVTNLTINNGGVLVDNNGTQTLTITGNVAINGTVNNGGGRVQLNVTGAASSISGSGTLNGVRVYISGTAVTIVAGSSLAFANSSRIYAGQNSAGTTVAASVLTINGTINSSVTTASTTFLRLYGNSTVIGTTGVVNADVSAATFNTATATLTNNGSVTLNRITQNAATNAWTQGVNSSLTISAVSTVGTLNANANGNTVTYNGTSTVIAPTAAGYWNLAGTIFPGACPIAYTVSGTNPCPAGGPTSVTMNPGSCVNVSGIGTLAWGTPADAVTSNNLYASVLLNDLQVSNYLRCTQYGFAIPAGATINGVTVNVERRASGTVIRDAAMRLVRDAAGLPVIQATDRSSLTTYPTTDTSEAHGGAADLWGGVWTPADINSANFGAAFASQKPTTPGGARTVRVDHMPITVTYTPVGLHHVTINAPTTAMSLTEVPVTIMPHTSTHGTIAAAGTINLSTSTGTGDWTIGSGTGTLTPGPVNSGLASYTFGAAESSVTLGFTAQSAGTVTLNVADSGGADLLLNTPVGEKANTIVFSAPAFVFTSSACTHNVAFGTPGQCALVTWSPRIAGQVLGSIYITSMNASGVPTRLHPVQVRTRDMQFALSCHDPVANAGVRATFDATAVALPLCEANGAVPTTWTAAVTLSFPGGSPSVGPYNFNYNDVGRVELWMRNGATPTEMGTSNTFVVKPSGFTLSNIRRSSDSAANPGAANATGAAFAKAGEAFTATVTAVNALGVATPNYGQELSPESVKLTGALVAGLGMTNNPAVTGSFGAFTSGAATGTTFKWDEVGVITLTPSISDANYLGAGDVTGTTSGNVGRFTLGKFALQNITFDNRADLCLGGFLVLDGVTLCASTYTYMGEQIDASFTLVPMSLNSAVIQNYVDSATAANDFAKLDPATFANLNMAAVDRTTAGGPYYLTSRISNAAMPVVTCATTRCFQTGSADVTVPFTLSRNAAPDGPFGTVEIGIAPVDSDGARVEGVGATPGACNNPNVVDCYDLDSDAVAGNDHALLAGTEFRYGRIKVSSAYGSERLPLGISATTQYWDGAAWQVSTTDSLSSFNTATDLVKTIISGTLAAADINVVGAGAVTVANGVRNFTLAAPNVSGSADIGLSAPSYLGRADGRATFGVYKGGSNYIYRREN